MGDFPYVEWLARLYKKVGEFSGSWTDYIKVSLLWYTHVIKTDKFFFGFELKGFVDVIKKATAYSI